MNIVMLGSGNVAAILGRKFKAAGHHIVQIYSRNTTTGSELAYEWDTESTSYKSLINKDADFYLFAVSDSAIAEVVSDLRLPGKVVAHTAASVPKEILETVSKHYGVFYPLQSLRKEISAIPEIPIFIDSSDNQAKQVLETLAHSIAADKVNVGNNDDRLKMHIAAVVVNNFVNHLYALAEDYCKKEGLDFSQLLPLIKETAARLSETAPQQAQTGPAIRHDKPTIEKHLDLLKEHPQLKNLYVLLTESIQQTK